MATNGFTDPNLPAALVAAAQSPNSLKGWAALMKALDTTIPRLLNDAQRSYHAALADLATG